MSCRLIIVFIGIMFTPFCLKFSLVNLVQANKYLSKSYTIKELHKSDLVNGQTNYSCSENFVLVKAEDKRYNYKFNDHIKWYNYKFKTIVFKENVQGFQVILNAD
jgi:hypothetical protein